MAAQPRVPARKRTPKKVAEPLFFTPLQIEQLLGLSMAGTYKLIHSGQFEVRYVGRNVRVFKASFDSWLAALPPQRLY
jgi:predicted DNA-binding transcriptional regulator AlpA